VVSADSYLPAANRVALPWSVGRLAEVFRGGA
jgi:hypothetical protein